MLIYYGNDKRIHDAKALVDKFFNDPSALKEITLSRSAYDHSNATPQQILYAMELFWTSYSTVVKTDTIKNWMGIPKKTPVLAYTSSPKELFLITNNLNRSPASIMGSVVHELSHCADKAQPKLSFGHAGNSSKNKQFSYPYFVGKRAKIWAEANYK